MTEEKQNANEELLSSLIRGDSDMLKKAIVDGAEVDDFCGDILSKEEYAIVNEDIKELVTGSNRLLLMSILENDLDGMNKAIADGANVNSICENILRKDEYAEINKSIMVAHGSERQEEILCRMYNGERLNNDDFFTQDEYDFVNQYSKENMDCLFPEKNMLMICKNAEQSEILIEAGADVNKIALDSSGYYNDLNYCIA